jgi:hypothetical protein
MGTSEPPQAHPTICWAPGFKGISLLGKTGPLVGRLSYDLSAFVGGGGGAAQVPGDGMILDLRAGLQYDLGHGVGLNGGLSYIKIKGSGVETPAVILGLTKHFRLSETAGQEPDLNYSGGGMTVRAAKPTLRYFMVGNSHNRSGGQLKDLSLVGLEIAADHGQNGEIFITSTGAAGAGGIGYMDVLAGYRHRWGTDNLAFTAQASLGFGGGGDVDTGGGLIGSAGVGLTKRITPKIDLELGADVIGSANGRFHAVSPYVRAAYVFGRHENSAPPLHTQRWDLVTGFTAQFANGAYHKSGAGQSVITMTQLGLDLFIDRHFYLTGKTAFAMSGGVGGYALGMLGAGYAQQLSSNWTISGEGYFGAAAGGGVNTRGGAIYGGRIGAEYALSKSLHLDAGIGMLRTVKGGGMAPKTFDFGLRMPFNTYR